MRCWRIDLHRQYALYVTGELSPASVKRVEDHLIDCGWCRTRLAQIRAGHRFAEQLPSFAPQRDTWGRIESLINEDQSRASNVAPPSRVASRRKTAIRAGLVTALTTSVVVVLILSSRQVSRSPGLAKDDFDFREFHPVAIAEIEKNTEPHIVAEGYVSEVRIDSEDGDLTFKLVEDIRRARPFIVCEIINPRKFSPPTVGSRVRVYGVSRYDGKAGHQWHEVHPVLNIEEVKH
jgi:hypothetical protein